MILIYSKKYKKKYKKKYTKEPSSLMCMPQKIFVMLKAGPTNIN